MKIYVNRRIPVYEFVLRTEEPVSQCEAVLREKVQEFPYAADVCGTVTGREFEIQPIGGMFAPFTHVFGYLVSQEDSVTDVVVVIHLDWWICAIPFCGLAFAWAVVDGTEPIWHAVATLAVALIVMALVQITEAHRIRAIFVRWFGGRR